MPHKTFCRLIGVFFAALSLWAQPLPVEADTTLLLRFDGNLLGVQGETPVFASTTGITYVPGLSGQAVQLSAGNQILFAAANNLNSTAGTLEFWIKPNWFGSSTTGPNWILTWADSPSTNNVGFGRNGVPNWTAFFQSSNELSESVAVNANSFPANQWRHAAFTWEGTTLRLYLDGVQVAQTTLAFPLPTPAAANFLLGSGSTTTPIDAAIDELRISNRARTATEINNSYNRFRPTVFGTISTLAGNGVTGYQGDNVAATTTALNNPIGVAVDAAGNTYIADFGNHRVRRVSTAGTITTVFGSGQATDGPWAVMVDAAQNIYIADYLAHVIRRIDAGTTIARIIAGTGVRGSSGDGGLATAALLNEPRGMVIDASGNLLFVESGGNRVRRITPAGIISTIAGTGAETSTGDGGPATSASLFRPYNLALRPDGSLLVVEFGSNRVRTISPTGVISTFAGPGSCPASGDGGPASAACLNGPVDIAIDASANVYILEYYASRIRKVGPDGVIMTIAGTGTPGFSGDGGFPTQAQFNLPAGIALDSLGNIVIGDSQNMRIRQIAIAGPTLSALSPESIRVGTTSLTLYLNGRGFSDNTTFFWNDTPILTRTGLSPRNTGIGVTVPASVLTQSAATAGSSVISARNLGQRSGPGLSLAITSGAPTPTITSAAPLWSYSPSTGALISTRVLRLLGTGFQPNAIATWNGLELPLSPSFPDSAGSPTANADVPVGLTQIPGPVTIRVRNSGGALSNTLNFDVPPLRVLSTVSPIVVPANNPFSLSAFGSGFAVGDAIQFFGPNVNSSSSPGSTFVNSSQLRIEIPATAVPAAGTYYAWVRYPGAGSTGVPGSANYATLSIPITVAPVGTCAFSLSTPSITLPAAASSGSVALSAPAGCGWTISNPVPWVSFTSATSGSGNATLTFNVQANPGPSARGTDFPIAGQPFLIIQAAPTCQFGVTTDLTSVPRTGLNSGTLRITTSTSACTWSASSSASWLRLTSTTGTGDANPTFTIDPNPASAGRTASLTVNGQSISFTQAGAAPCSYSLTQSTQSISAASTSDLPIEVTSPAGCTWSATSPVPWVTIQSGAANSGNGTVILSVAANPASTVRSASLTIAGQNFVLTQASGTDNTLCTLNAGIPAIVAAEGRTELVADLVLSCSGLPPSVLTDLELVLNTNVTNGLAPPTLTINNATPLPGRITGYNSIRWAGVRLTTTTEPLRFANIRVDASLLATAQPGIFVPITANLRLNSTAPIPLANPTLTVAFASPGFTLQRGTTTQSGTFRTVPVLFREGFAAAFQTGTGVPAATRLLLSLRNVPTGVKVFAPVFPAQGPARAQLISADSNGLGGFPLAGSTLANAPYQELTPAAGTVTATWQLLSSDPNNLETLTFPLLLQNASEAQAAALLASVAGGFAPLSSISLARPDAPLPRFRDLSSLQRRVNLRLTTALTSPVAAASKSLATRALFAANAPIAITNTVKNDTESAATNAQVTNSLSSGLLFSNCSVPCTNIDGQVTIPLGSIPAGEERSVTINATVAPALNTGGTLGNWATSDSDDPTADLRTASASTSITISPAPPSVTLPEPINGSGLTKTFVLQYSNPSGWARLGVLNALINNALDGGNACYIAYSVPANVLFLVADRGPAEGLSAPLSLGTPNSVSNSQCTVNGVGSSAVGNGNIFTLTLNITFRSTFTGSKIVYLAARDDENRNSGWSTSGIHQVPGGPTTFPNPVSMNPPIGTSTGGLISFSFDDQSNSNNLQTLWALVNTALDGRNACYVVYFAPGNLIGLYPDNGDGAAVSLIPLSGNATLRNSQCEISTNGSNVVRSGARLTLNLNMAFKPAFTGTKVVWMALQTLTAITSPWKANGAWQVPP